jgi:hypothetical protein
MYVRMPMKIESAIPTTMTPFSGRPELGAKKGAKKDAIHVRKRPADRIIAC